MSNLPDIVRNDTENYFNSRNCKSGIILYEPVKLHACNKPAPQTVSYNSIWQCEDCHKLFKRTRSKWDGYSAYPEGKHSPQFYWHSVSEKFVERYLKKAIKLRKKEEEALTKAKETEIFTTDDLLLKKPAQGYKAVLPELASKNIPEGWDITANAKVTDQDLNLVDKIFKDKTEGQKKPLGEDPY